MSGRETVGDLAFEVSVAGGETVHGRLRGRGGRLWLDLDVSGTSAGRHGTPAIRLVADAPSGPGLSVAVRSGGEHLVTLGGAPTPWWRRPLAGSRDAGPGRLRGAWAAGRSRREVTSSPPDDREVPPATLVPVAPPVVPGMRSRPSTTHSNVGGGAPRLVLVPQQAQQAQRQNGRPASYRLSREVTTIGSDPSCDIVLPGLTPLHAEVRRNEHDEIVLTARNLDTRVDGERVRSRTLRTASQVEMGELTLAYYREDDAGYGRLLYGRVGGEGTSPADRPDPDPRHPHPPPEAS